MKYSNIILQPLKSHKFKVLKSFKFKGVRVEAGFTTDGASSPRFVWWIFPPNRTDYLPCAIIHDWLCDKEEYKKADRLFKECLEELGVDRFSRMALYLAVRLYHIIRYQQ